MKTSMHSFKKFVPALALAVTALSVSAAETAKLTVDGMVCAFCAQGIEKRLSALPSTQSLYVNLEQKIVAIEAKPGQALDLERIKAEVTDAGYAVAKTETVTQSVAEIKAAMKAKK